MQTKFIFIILNLISVCLTLMPAVTLTILMFGTF